MRVPGSLNPFTPDAPVDIDYFRGRDKQLEEVEARGLDLIPHGRSSCFFIEGEYGIGKTSFASFVMDRCRGKNILPIYLSLNSVTKMSEFPSALLVSALDSGALDDGFIEGLRNKVADFVGKQSAFGVSLDANVLRVSYPQIESPVETLRFLRDCYERQKRHGLDGIMLVIDEIDKLSADVDFANFLKGLVDNNAVAKHKLPFVLMLCGVGQARHRIIQSNPSVARLFNVVPLTVLESEEVKEFFENAFDKISTDAMELLLTYSQGYPKVMQLIEFETWELVRGQYRVESRHVQIAILRASEQIGKRYVEVQILGALSSPVYRSILRKVGMLGPDKRNFTKEDLREFLTSTEISSFSSFIKRMRQLNVLRNGQYKGEYQFTDYMIQIHLFVEEMKKRLDYLPDSKEYIDQQTRVERLMIERGAKSDRQ